MVIFANKLERKIQQRTIGHKKTNVKSRWQIDRAEINKSSIRIKINRKDQSNQKIRRTNWQFGKINTKRK